MCDAAGVCVPVEMPHSLCYWCVQHMPMPLSVDTGYAFLGPDAHIPFVHPLLSPMRSTVILRSSKTRRPLSNRYHSEPSSMGPPNAVMAACHNLLVIDFTCVKPKHSVYQMAFVYYGALPHLRWFNGRSLPSVNDLDYQLRRRR